MSVQQCYRLVGGRIEANSTGQAFEDVAGWAWGRGDKGDRFRLECADTIAPDAGVW